MALLRKYILTLMILLALIPNGMAKPERVPVTSEGRPSLLCIESDLDVIRLRLGRQPYERWWASAIQVAKAGPVERKEIDDRQVEYVKRARHAAFCYLITGDEAFANIALDRLTGLPKMEPKEMDGKSHLKLAQTGRDFAEAYDIILPWLEETHPDERDIIAGKLRYIGWELRKFGPNWYGVHKNNHGIRQFSGLGLVALALRDDPDYTDEAETWLEYAIKNCLDHLRHQICDPDEGGFAEGMGYFRYSGDIFWAFFFALKNVTGRDLWAEPDIRALHIYAARVQMPTGCWPMFDDCTYGYFPCQIFCDAYPDDAALFVDRFLARQSAWDEGYGECRNNGQRIKPADDYILSLIHYDDTIEPVAPSYPTIEVLEKAGDAVFRAGDGPEGIYLNMRIEGKRATFNAAGHDQPDALSFFIQAYGENLLLDPGYIKWEERKKVATSDNHNMITVDDSGPMHFPGNVQIDGFVEVVDYGIDPHPFIEARTRYRGATLTRRIEFVDGKFFIIRDTASSEIPRSFTLNLHGHNNIEERGNFSRYGNLVTWQRERAGVVCCVLSNVNDAGRVVDEDEHSFGYGEWSLHNALRVRAKAAEVKFLTVVFPYETAWNKPTFLPYTPGEGLRVYFDGKRYEINVGFDWEWYIGWH